MKKEPPGRKAKPGKSSHPRNTSGLQANAERKAQAARKKVIEAIDHLLMEGQTVNFNAVREASGVSRSYLYGSPDLRARIEAQRQAPRLRLVSGPVQETGRTERSTNLLLTAKDIKIQELESEVRRLKEENKKLHGRLYETLTRNSS